MLAVPMMFASSAFVGFLSISGGEVKAAAWRMVVIWWGVELGFGFVDEVLFEAEVLDSLLLSFFK